MKVTFINAIEIWNHQSVAESESTYMIGLPRPESTYTIGLPTSAIGQSLDLPLPLMQAAVMAECHSTILDLYIDSAVTASTSPIIQLPAPQPIPQPPTLTPLAIQPTPHRGASIVMLIPLILLTVAVILIKIGISTIIPIIGSLIRFTGSIWQSVSDTDRGIESIPIDYPLAAAA